MHYLPLLFICVKMFSFIYYRELAIFLHNFRLIVETRKHTKHLQVLFIDRTTIFFTCYFLMDILFLGYCIWLILGTQWQPGCMLLFIAALESYGVQARIDGTYNTSSKGGFAYAKSWFKYLMTAQTIFILLELLQSSVKII